MTIKRRLLKAINSLNIKRSEFAKSIDVSNGNLSDWLNVKKTSKPSIAALVRICETYNINMNWLLTGKGSMVISDESDAHLTSSSGKLEKLELLKSSSKTKIDNPTSDADCYYTRTASMPIEAEIAAGDPIPVGSSENSAYVEIPRVFLKDDVSKYCVFRINGHSMEPEVHHQDIIVIRYQHNWESDGWQDMCCQNR